MEYTHEYVKEIKNEKHHTRSKSDECSALVLDNGDTDPIHIYWDQKTKSFSTWSF